MLDDKKISELLDEAGLVLIPVIGSNMGDEAEGECPESPIAIDEELWAFARLVEAEVRERLAKQAEAAGGSLTAAEIRNQA